MKRFCQPYFIFSSLAFCKKKYFFNLPVCTFEGRSVMRPKPTFYSGISFILVCHTSMPANICVRAAWHIDTFLWTTSYSPLTVLIFYRLISRNLSNPTKSAASVAERRNFPTFLSLGLRAILVFSGRLPVESQRVIHHPSKEGSSLIALLFS